MSINRNYVVAGAALTVGAVTFHKSMQHQLIDAYSTRDPKLVKKAYNRMMRKALSGKYLGVDLTDDFLNDEFDTLYYQLEDEAA